ncbi:MAG: hypothetical protein JWP59_2670 [Massilia sp.]|jgi:hypothetical protein|nr:hypothetical protein [Massilia sp.]
MSKNLKSGVRLVHAASALLAVAAIAGAPLTAVAQEQSSPEATADNLTVARDAVTGKIRAATAEEHAQLAAIRAAKARNFRVSPKQSVRRFHKSGANGVTLSEEMRNANTLVAIKGADGTIEMRHYNTAAEADAAVQAGPTANPTTASE